MNGWVSGFAATVSIVCALSLSIACATPARAAPAARAADADCTATVTFDSPLADRSGTIAALQGLPDACLKRVMIECQGTADEALLDLGSAAICSMAYEALLRKSFGGDFQALLAWWRSERRAD